MKKDSKSAKNLWGFFSLSPLSACTLRQFVGEPKLFS